MRNLITDVEKEMIVDRMYTFSEGACVDRVRSNVEDYFLSNWEEAKSVRLFKLFGDNLILKKAIEIEKSESAIKREMDRANFRFVNKFEWEVLHELRQTKKITSEQFFFLRDMASLKNLVANRISDSGEIEWEGKKYKFQSGQKLTKVFKTLVEMFKEDFGLNETLLEEFRIKHSQILNDKYLRGNLCLSIHPLDYMTLSDNNSGWSSCMSWEEQGCHRAGTLEMINCENTVVAYLESGSRTMQLGGKEWNSKKYRQLIMITPDMIMTNKAYPYRSDELSKVGLDWLTDLAEQNLEMEFFPDAWAYDDGEGDIPGVDDITVNCDFMYDDTDNCSHSFIRLAVEHNSHISLTLGGDARCISCGDSISDSDTLNCNNCRRDRWCECCEEYHHEDDMTNSINGEICTRCAEKYYVMCDNCCEHVYKDDAIYIDEEEHEETGVPEGAYCCYCHELELKKIDGSKAESRD